MDYMGFSAKKIFEGIRTIQQERRRQILDHQDEEDLDLLDKINDPKWVRLAGEEDIVLVEY
jgi:hypothetical protein